MEHSNTHYYVPEHSKLPFLGALGLFLLGYGTLNLLHSSMIGTVLFMAGAIILAGVLFAWFREVINEQMAGLYNEQISHSFQWGMIWFFVTEIFLFGIFMAALFYARVISVPGLAGIGNSQDFLTHIMFWPNFKDVWPLLTNPNPVAYPGSTGTVDPWHVPLLNTIVMLLSAVSVTFAYRFLKRSNRTGAVIGLSVTIVLGLIFVFMQAQEFLLAHNEYGLKLSSGIYGSTFFMLVGLHTAHVIVGLLMLAVMLLRTIKGHFNAKDNFGFKATLWFWQFITVIWLITFVFVYCL